MLAVDRVVTLRPAVADEPLEVGERLGDGESSGGGAEIVAEERIRHLVPGARLGPERGRREPQPLLVMRDQLTRAADRVGDDVSVTAVGDRGRELDRALERLDVVAERIGSALRPEPDGRGDPREKVIGCNQDAVSQKRQLTVGVAGRGNDLPAVQQLPVVDELGARRRF